MDGVGRARLSRGPRRRRTRASRARRGRRHAAGADRADGTPEEARRVGQPQRRDAGPRSELLAVAPRAADSGAGMRRSERRAPDRLRQRADFHDAAAHPGARNRVAGKSGGDFLVLGYRRGARCAPPRRKRMPSEVTVIDADGHILEPPDLWERYLEPKYRERAIRIVVGQDGYEYLEIDRKISRLCRRGQLATLGGMGKKVADAARMRERAMSGELSPEELRYQMPGPGDTYLTGAAFGTMDMKERVALLDREGMAKAVLYPTLGLMWEAESFDAEISTAYCRAY